MNELHKLAARVPSGDSVAARELRHELEDQMVRVVRRALASGKASSPLSQRVQCEAQRVSAALPDRRQATAEQVVQQVARRMCASVMEGLQPRALRETVRN